MDEFLRLDWSATFAPEMSLPEILIRGSVIYLALLVLLRVLPKWQAGPGSMASMLFVVLLGNIAAGGVVGNASSVTDILLLVATVTLWVVAVDWLSYRFPWLRDLVQHGPTCLIRDGRLLRRNLQREIISEEDLKTQLRRHDVDDIGDVLEAYLEADGSISVIKKESAVSKERAGNTKPGDEISNEEPRDSSA